MFSVYQDMATRYRYFPEIGRQSIFYIALGLAGETGEIINEIKKYCRDDHFEITDLRCQKISEELGDLLWYLSQVATEFGLNLDNVVDNNILKIQRKFRERQGGD